jgi:hypothetical protein
MSADEGKYVSDPRPPRVDWDRLKNGPTAEALIELPPTTAKDWENAELLIPIDPETYREFRAFLARRRKKAAGAPGD